MKRSLYLVFALITLCTILIFGAVTVSAEESTTYYEGYYSFVMRVNPETQVSEVIITDCDNEITGNVTVPSHLGGQFPVVGIAAGAFSDCTYMTSVTIGSRVQVIGAYAFRGCTNLQKISIADSVTSIGTGAFQDTAYYKSANNWVDDVLYVGNHLIAAKTSKTGACTVKNGTVSIADWAFENCTAITSVSIPDTVQGIGIYALYNCTGITKITTPFIGASLDDPETTYMAYLYGGSYDYYNREIPQALKEVVVTKQTGIPEDAFDACYYIEKITLSNTVETIGKRSFSNCYSLKEINLGNSVTSVGERAFENCGNLTQLTIPKSTTSIGSNILTMCDSLEKLTIPFVGNDMDGTISCRIYYYFNTDYLPSSLKEVVITNAKVIGYGAFWCTNSIESITIPATVEKIDEQAFERCTSLKKVNITSLEAWCQINFGFNYANPLCYAKNLYINGKLATDITIPSSVTTLAARAFAGCTSLKTVTIQNGMTTVGNWAFKDCSNLTTISIPTSVQWIVDAAFSGCDNLKTVYYRGTEAQKNAIWFNNYNDNLKNATWYYNSCNGTATHRYNSGVVTKKATCKDAGVKTFTCTVCGAKKTQSIAKLTTHTYTTSTTKATLSKAGKVTKKCSVCGKTATSAIAYPKTFKLSATSYTYDGKTKTPSVTIKDTSGKTLKKDTDYTVTYASGRKDVGTYKVTVKMKGNYTGTKVLTFKINPAKATSKFTFKLSDTSYTYNGKAKTPTVTVKDAAGKTLKKNTDYTVTYAKDRKNVGTYKVTVKMKGNYTGTKTLTFKIVPKAASINKLTAKTKAITVKLNRSLQQSTGYEIQYSTAKTFKGAKKMVVKSYKTSSATLSGLKAKTTYFVRVRTYKVVDGTKIYSNWSTYKSIRTK